MRILVLLFVISIQYCSAQSNQMGFWAEPEWRALSAIFNSEQGKVNLGYTTGIHFGYALSNTTQINVGLGIGKSSFEWNHYNLIGLYSKKDTFQGKLNYLYEYQRITIPLQIIHRWQFSPQSKFSLLLSYGVSFGKITQPKITAQNHPNFGTFSKSYPPYGKLHSLLDMFQISLGLNYQISPKIGLSIQPNVKMIRNIGLGMASGTGRAFGIRTMLWFNVK